MWQSHQQSQLSALVVMLIGFLLIVVTPVHVISGRFGRAGDVKRCCFQLPCLPMFSLTSRPHDDPPVTYNRVL